MPSNISLSPRTPRAKDKHQDSEINNQDPGKITINYFTPKSEIDEFKTAFREFMPNSRDTLTELETVSSHTPKVKRMNFETKSPEVALPEVAYKVNELIKEIQNRLASINPLKIFESQNNMNVFHQVNSDPINETS